MIGYNHILVEKICNLHYMDCDSLVLSIKTQNMFNDIQNLENLFAFSTLNKDHELFNEKKRLLANLKLKLLKNIWIDECIALKSEV